MAIVIREYLGSPMGINENSFTPFSLKENLATDYTIAEDSIMVDIEGIHVGPTRNFTWYTEQALKGSVKSWTTPYQRPLILHHNEKDGKIIGRVLSAHYTDVNTRSKTGALVFTCNVPEEDGKKGVKDGRLKTVSIGAIAHDVRCSICGHDISQYGECEHERGAEYDGQVCYWMIYEMEAKELSYVIVPSDIYAHNIKVYSPKKNKNITESLTEGVKSMTTTNTVNENIKPTVIVEDADKHQQEGQQAVQNTYAQTNSNETNQTEDETVETLKSTVISLQSVIAGLQRKAEKAEAAKKAAEEELVNAHTQVKEFAIEQISMLREQLGRPSLEKATLIKRSQESLIDSIYDLKEELGVNKTASIKVTESTEGQEEPKEPVTTSAINVSESAQQVNVGKSLASINKVTAESLVDSDKDSSVKKEEDEKKSSVDVKENLELSNINYEDALSFFNI